MKILEGESFVRKQMVDRWRDNSLSQKLLFVRGRPKKFYGRVALPPSKSYLHRSLFIAAMSQGVTEITNCGKKASDDVAATIDVLRSFGVSIRKSIENGGTYFVSRTNRDIAKNIEANAGASGTTARFAIAAAAVLTPITTLTRIVGDGSLSKRPMDSIFQPLSQLGVSCTSVNSDGKLPIEIRGGGLKGESCVVDGSVSSQFISSLLISCTMARDEVTVSIRDPEKVVSEPYVEATVEVLLDFGFHLDRIRTKTGELSGFTIRKERKSPTLLHSFRIPGDMSSGASMIAACLAAKGRITLENFGPAKFPQSDAAIIEVARKLGAEIKEGRKTMKVQLKRETPQRMELDLRDSPDLVPVVAGLAAATNSVVAIKNIGHLQFKESDRLAVLSRELSKLGIKTTTTSSSICVYGADQSNRSQKRIFIDPEKDHRMLMALTVAGLSGKFGELYIRDPDCVKKSYPDFVRDIQKLCGEKSTLKIIQEMDSGVSP